MSVILSVYSKNAFKEFVLPAENDTEVTLLLEYSMFQIRKDIALKLEVLDGKSTGGSGQLHPGFGL